MNKIAVVTGSAGGLGKGIAEKFAHDDFKVLVQDINKKLLLETEKEWFYTKSDW